VASSRQGLSQCGESRRMPSALKCLSDGGRIPGRTRTSGISMRLPKSAPISSAEAILVRRTATPAQMEIPNIPTCPATSSPWSQDAALGGWSARMFLHQVSSTSKPLWTTSDTERLLSASSPRHLRASFGRGITLSGVIKPPRKASATCFRTPRMVEGLIRRALARGRSLRLLLRTGRDTIPVIVTFGNKGTGYESWTLKSARPLRASQRDGLLAFLKRHAPECSGTQRHPK